MSQYTNSYTTSAGSVVNTILDTVTNTQATTVVTASGKTATVTYPIGGASPAIARSLVEQLGIAEPGVPLGLSRTSNDVLGQQASATEEDSLLETHRLQNLKQSQCQQQTILTQPQILM